MTDTSNPLETDFKLFRDECEKLRDTYNTYRKLYESGDDVEQLLKRSAGLFFSDLNEWIIELLILRIGRLTDPSNTAGKKNLTVCWIVEELERARRLTPEIDGIAKDILQYRKLILPARNKVVAHNDLSTFRDSLKHGEHDRNEAAQFFEDMQRFTDAVGSAIGIGPLDYSVSVGRGDVVDLLRKLKNLDRIE